MEKVRAFAAFSAVFVAVDEDCKPVVKRRAYLIPSDALTPADRAFLADIDALNGAPRRDQLAYMAGFKARVLDGPGVAKFRTRDKLALAADQHIALVSEFFECVDGPWADPDYGAQFFQFFQEIDLEDDLASDASLGPPEGGSEASSGILPDFEEMA